MQTTADGATYLQVIFLSILLFGVVIMFVESFRDAIEDLSNIDTED